MRDDGVLEELYTYERGEGATRVVVALKEYKGARFVDLRTHVRGPDGEYYPTQKGVTVPMAHLRAVTGALVAAQRESAAATPPRRGGTR